LARIAIGIFFRLLVLPFEDQMLMSKFIKPGKKQSIVRGGQVTGWSNSLQSYRLASTLSHKHCRMFVSAEKTTNHFNDPYMDNNPKS